MPNELQGYVMQYAAAPGTASTVQLTTSVSGRRTFLDVFPSGGTTFYYIDDGTKQEWGDGAYNSSANTIARTVTGNSEGTTSRLDFSSGGAVRVYNDIPPERAVYHDADGVLQSGSSAALVLQGTATNDDAATGIVGEYAESKVVSGSAVSLTSTVAANVTSFTLGAGDWDVEGTVAFVAGGSTQLAGAIACISLVSATLDTADNGGRDDWFGTLTGLAPCLSPGTRRISLDTPTIVYLVASCAFTVSTLAAYGMIRARRMR